MTWYPQLSFRFIRKTGRTTIQLSREKVVVPEDEQTGGYEEFVVVDEIAVSEEKCLLIIEAKRSSVSQATKQLMLAMKDARDQGGIIYGFVTTGGQWRMVKYDGKSFSQTEIMMLVFDTMSEDKERWLNDCTAVIDCLNLALGNEDTGIVKKDMVV